VSKQKVWWVYHEAAEAINTVYAICYVHHILPAVEDFSAINHCDEATFAGKINITAIMCSANCPEAEKTSTISEALEHLYIVKMERTYYKSTYDECKTSIQDHFTTDGELSPPSLSSTCHTTQTRSKCTILPITHSRCTARLTLSNQV